MNRFYFLKTSLKIVPVLFSPDPERKGALAMFNRKENLVQSESETCPAGLGFEDGDP